MTDLNSAAGDPSPVHALVQQRDQLRAWIAKLDEVAQGAPSRVAERIRQDYGDRLARVTAELGEHREEIGRNLESMRAELRDAEERHTQASEALEEAQLRNLIGELSDDEWGSQRERLEGELSAAEEETRRIGGEVERLSALAGEVAGDAADTETAFASAAEEPTDEVPVSDAAADEGPADDAPAPEPVALRDDDATDESSGWLNEINLDEPASAPLDPPAAAAAEEASGASWDPFGNEFGGASETPQSDVGGGDLPWLETPDRAADAWTPASTEDDGLEFLNDLGSSAPESASTSDLAEDDLAFLEELDRAISGSPAASRSATPPPAPSTPSAGDSPATGSSGGPLLCKECGAINEPHSWYCEICGSEL
jgi:predicted secreted protein